MGNIRRQSHVELSRNFDFSIIDFLPLLFILSPCLSSIVMPSPCLSDLQLRIRLTLKSSHLNASCVPCPSKPVNATLTPCNGKQPLCPKPPSKVQMQRRLAPCRVRRCIIRSSARSKPSIQMPTACRACSVPNPNDAAKRMYVQETNKGPGKTVQKRM